MKWRRRWQLMTNGKVDDTELEDLLKYYITMNTYSRTLVDKENQARIFKVMLALNELKELRDAVKDLKRKNDGKSNQSN